MHLRSRGKLAHLAHSGRGKSITTSMEFMRESLLFRTITTLLSRCSEVVLDIGKTYFHLDSASMTGKRGLYHVMGL